MSQDFKKGFGSCFQPDEGSLSGEALRDQAATIDAEETELSQEQLEARAAARLKAAREYQHDAELDRFVRAFQSTPRRASWARTRSYR